jgi:hypothetical protein
MKRPILYKKNNSQVWYSAYSDFIFEVGELNHFFQRDNKGFIFLGWLK